MRSTAGEPAITAEDDQVAMRRTGGGGHQERVIAFGVEPVADGLACRPLLGDGEERWKTDSLEALVAVEQGDALEIDAPAPQVPWEGLRGRDAGGGQGAVPLRPGGGRFVSEVEGLDDVAVLPAAVGRVGRLIERVCAVRDVADEDVADGGYIDVEGRHL